MRRWVSPDIAPPVIDEVAVPPQVMARTSSPLPVDFFISDRIDAFHTDQWRTNDYGWHVSDYGPPDQMGCIPAAFHISILITDARNDLE